MRWRAGALAGVALVAAGCSAGAGATGPTGTVAGTFLRMGGPAGTPNMPLPGTITFRGQDGSTISVSSDGKGKFTGQLPPGTYAVTAESNLINEGKAPCSRPLTTRVQVGKTITITLVCDIP